MRHDAVPEESVDAMTGAIEELLVCVLPLATRPPK
jgi:hypothetical protein